MHFRVKRASKRAICTVNPEDWPTEPAAGQQIPSVRQLNEILPNYEVTELIGQGGMGAVFKALQPNLDRHVAIKVLPMGLAEDDGEEQFVERFKQEAKAMAKLNHPAIIQVHDSGEAVTPGGRRLLYFVMEFIQGADIRDYLKEKGGKLKPEAAHAIISHVLDALGFAHENGIIHRDIKPANIMLDHRGLVKVADFGVAKALGAGGDIDTKTHMMVGTPDYVAPEARDLGCAVDGRADLFAMGAMFYELLTGKLPKGAFKPPAEISPDIDPRYDAVITKALQPEPDDRYQSAEEFQEDLEQILREPILAPAPIIQSGQELEADRDSDAISARNSRRLGEFLLRIAVFAMFSGTAWALFASASESSGWLPNVLGGWLAVSGIAALTWRPPWFAATLLFLSLFVAGWQVFGEVRQADNRLLSLAPASLLLLVPLGLLLAAFFRWRPGGWLAIRLALVLGFAVYAAVLAGLPESVKIPGFGALDPGGKQLAWAEKLASTLIPALDAQKQPWSLRLPAILALLGCAGLWNRFSLGASSILLALLAAAGLAAFVLDAGFGAYRQWAPVFLLHLPLLLAPIALWRLVEGEARAKTAPWRSQHRRRRKTAAGSG